MGPYDSNLSNSGEEIAYAASSGARIEAFTYDDGGSWPERADGDGSSLERIDNFGSASLAESWRQSGEFHGSPGVAGLGSDTRIVVNEILANPIAPGSDFIELWNSSSSEIDLSGWHLSDDERNYSRFQIPADSVIPAGGYLVLDESDFNSSGTPADFELSAAYGGDLFLIEVNAAGKPLRFAHETKYDASLPGMSQGLWPNGTGRLVPMTVDTPGMTNSEPRIGQVVISEIMYHPVSNSVALEFIELYNTGGSSVNLVNWTLRGGVDYDFKATDEIPSGGTLVLVSFSPSDPVAAGNFRSNYGIAGDVVLAGPWEDGAISNGGDFLKLRRPDIPPMDDAGFHPQVIEDVSEFLDQAPWPVLADGGGQSLQRMFALGFGSFASSWAGALPSPGEALTSGDPDGDDVDYLLEYALGMDPLTADAELLPKATMENGVLSFRYPKDRAKTDIRYQMEKSDDLESWFPLADELLELNGQIETRRAQLPSGEPRNFMRLRVVR